MSDSGKGVSLLFLQRRLATASGGYAALSVSIYQLSFYENHPVRPEISILGRFCMGIDFNE